MNGKLCFQTVKLFIIQGLPIHLTIGFWANLYMYRIYIYVQFISRSCKNLKLCASLHVAKAPVLFSLLDKRWFYDPGFLMKTTFISEYLTPISTLSGNTSHKRRQRCIPAYAGRSCSAGHLKLLTCHKGNRAELWSRGTVTKAILVWGKIGVSSAPQADVATGLTCGACSCRGQVKFTTGTDADLVDSLSRSWRARWGRWKGTHG